MLKARFYFKAKKMGLRPHVNLLQGLMVSASTSEFVNKLYDIPRALRRLIHSRTWVLNLTSVNTYEVR